MKILVKLSKFLLSAVLFVLLLVSLSVGVLREIKHVKVEITEYEIYTLEGCEYEFRGKGQSLILVHNGLESECTVEDLHFEVELDGEKITGILADDLSSVNVLVDMGDTAVEGEPVYLNFIKGDEPIIVETSEEVIYSKYVMEFLRLDEFEKLVGRHYFNSIACSMAGTTFTTLSYLAMKSIKNSIKKSRKSKSKKVAKPVSSIVTKIPYPVKSNPTQGSHNLKF